MIQYTIDMMLSVVAPAYNESGNLEEFIDKTDTVLKKITPDYEILIVNDGSIDTSRQLLKELKNKHHRLKVITLPKRLGQTAALMSGFAKVKGEIVVILDSDLQHDPRDIKLLIQPILNDKADVVSGRRQNRQHPWTVKLIAAIGYWLEQQLLQIPIKDTSVSPNAYKRSTLTNLRLYGFMHRFLVPLLYSRGYKIAEVNLPHYPRKSGVSKYTLGNKIIYGFFDLLLFKYWQNSSVRLMHVFGILGLGLIAAGVPIFFEEIIRKFVFGEIVGWELTLTAVLSVLGGLIFFILAALTDVYIKMNYYEKSQ